MQAATDAVCLADSDDEDYISFDEAEMDTGIKELYSDDSASDAGSDMSNPDMNFDDLEAPVVDTILSSSAAAPAEIASLSTINSIAPSDAATGITSSLVSSSHAAPTLPSIPSQQSYQQQMPQQQQQQQQQQAPLPQAAPQSMFGRLFGGGRRNSNESSALGSISRSKAQVRRSAFDSDDDNDNDNYSSINANFSFSNANNNNNSSSNRNRNGRRNAKKGKVGKLEKRLKRLSEFRKTKEAQRSRTDRKIVHRQKVNTNVVSINLGTLKENALQIVTGDPIFCKNPKCCTVLSKHDKLLEKLEKGDDGSDGTDELKVDSENGEYIWICQFCNTINVIEIDDEGEKPQGETLDYIIEPPSEAKQNEDDGLIIFCIDVSGSMCVTQEVKGKFNLKGDHVSSQLQDFSAFIDAGDRLNQYLPNQNRDVTWVSRLQAVQAAVDEQIAAIKKEKPKFKIAIVSFANDVVIIGDGVQKTEVVAGDKLKDLQKLQEIGRNYAVDHTLDKSYDKLSDALWKLTEGGQTALGPALAVSIAMAESKRGSQVILCTDGLANVGVGSIEVEEAAKAAQQAQQPNDDEAEEDEDAVDPTEQWYENLGLHAMEKGVIVNVISITDDGCKLENLGKLTAACNGTVKRINPLKLTEKFSGILGNDLLATRTQATMYLHPGLEFHSSIEAAAKKDAEQDDQTINELLDLVDLGVKKDDKQNQQAAAPKESNNDDNNAIVSNPTEATEPPKAASSAAIETESKDASEIVSKTDEAVVEIESKDATTTESKESKEDDNNNTIGPITDERGRKIELVQNEMQDVGNVFDTSELFFEYMVRKARIPDFRKLTHLPFQCHIRYEKLDGTKMLRVITQMRPVVFDRKKVRENVNVDILAKYGTRVTTELCSKGDYESSRAFTQANTVWMQRNINTNSTNNTISANKYRSQMVSLANYANMNMALDHEMHKQIHTESIQANDDDLLELEEERNESANVYRGGAMAFGSLRPMSNNAMGGSSASRGISSNSSYLNSYNEISHNNNNNNNSNRSYSSYGSSSKSKKKSKAKSRKSARNDKFSSNMYRMSRK